MLKDTLGTRIFRKRGKFMRNETGTHIFGDTPEEFHKSVNSALEKIAEREETNMSRSMGIRKIVVAAAVVAAFGVTAIAAMKAAGLESHTDLRDAVYSVSEIQELSDDEDFGVKYIDEFSNGYKFEVGYPSVGKATDADGNHNQRVYVIRRRATKTATAKSFSLPSPTPM